jgi:gamma-glutamylcyclotransferase (GGCT)/AIG2-like uncharacterized protein YtfP
MPDLLFIYGTLHPDRAPAEIAPVTRTLRWISPAKIRGTLLDLGAYPGVILDAESTEEVAGELFALPVRPEAQARTWARLDAYEGFDSLDSAASLFVRQRAWATLPDGSQILCFVYSYNQNRASKAPM